MLCSIYIQRLIDYNTKLNFVKYRPHTSLCLKLYIPNLLHARAPKSAPPSATPRAAPKEASVVGPSKHQSSITWGAIKALFYMCKSTNYKLDKGKVKRR